MAFNILSYIAISIFTILITKLLFSFNNKSNILHPPSPPSFPIIGHLHHFKKPLHHALARLSARHGPILLLRFGSRPVLVVSSSSIAEECFTKNDIAFANRVQFPSAKHRTYNYTTIGSANYGSHWRNIRRIATVDVLSPHRLITFNELRVSEVRLMVRRLSAEAKNEGFTKVELKSRLFGLSLNNMMRMIGGKMSGTWEEEEEASKFQEAVETMFSMSGASSIENFLPVLGLFQIGKKEKSMRLTKYMDEFLQGMIEDHRRREVKKGGEEEKTMIGGLLALQKDDPEYYNDQIIKALFNSLLSAGTDTSSDTIEWAIALLLNNPDKLGKAQAEIDQRTSNKSLLQESDLPNLPYLQCIITETLRLYPAGPLLVPHESAEDCTVSGYKIPRGTMLLVNAYAIHRDPNTWNEPEKFMPERFEEKNGNDVQDCKMLPFGMGRRRCPGEGLARRVVGLVLGSLIQCFEWERVSEELVDMSEGSGLTLPKEVPLEAMGLFGKKQEMLCY
uniref:Cytochrome P450 CYP81 n=1 Tax=Narcissus tazetta TaxID=54860 RepID=M9T6G5_NARTA|nr:cytochrome P450 CYP81 [Narcissus tazetta]